MATSVYISNSMIQAVYGEASPGRIAIRSSAEIPLTDGAMINGIIMDDQAIVYALKQMKLDFADIPFKNIRLVIASSQIFVKTASVPVLAKAKTLELIKSEFIDIETDGELIYDYTELKRDKGKGMTILMCAAKRELIGSYLDVFAAADITISCVDIVQNARSKLLGLYPELSEATYIFLDFDGNSLDSALYSDGIFKFSNRARLINEAGSAAWSSELEQIVSNIIQFNKTDRSNAPVTILYAAGLGESSQEAVLQIGSTFGIKASILPQNDAIKAKETKFRVSGFAAALGNLIF